MLKYSVLYKAEKWQTLRRVEITLIFRVFTERFRKCKHCSCYFMFTLSYSTKGNATEKICIYIFVIIYNSIHIYWNVQLFCFQNFDVSRVLYRIKHLFTHTVLKLEHCITFKFRIARKQHLLT